MTNAFGIFWRGLLMGIADLVPGISGGTVAYLTGIYPRFISALTSINKTNLKKLLRFNIGDFFKSIDGSFLFFLACGIFGAIFLGSRGFKYF